MSALLALARSKLTTLPMVGVMFCMDKLRMADFLM